MKSIILFVFFYLMSATFLQAQEQIFVIDSLSSVYKLNDFTYFHADSTNTISLEQIQKPIFPLALYAKPKTAIKPKTVYWYKIRLTNKVKTQVNFALDIGNFEVLDFYILGQNQLPKTQKTGSKIPFSQRASTFKANILPFTIPYGDTLTIIGKGQIQTDKQAYFSDITLSQPELYQQKYTEYTEKQLFFQGAMLLMFFYNLFFFFMVRDRAYLYYSLYVLSMLLVSVEVYDWMQEMPYFLEILSNLVPLFVTLLYTQFIRYFLNIPQINPKLNRYCDYWILGRMIFTLVIILVYHQTPSKIPNDDVVLMVFIFDILLGLVLIYTAWKNNPILARYMVVGYLAMTLPLSAAILKQVIFASTNAETDGVIVQIGVLVELITFSLGLGYRSKVAEKEKLQISEENRKIILEQNTVLEQKVSIRTEELNSTLQTVEKQRDNIISSINYALRIQNAIIPKEQEIQKYFPESFVLFRPKDIVSGDFYWFADKITDTGNKKIIVVADCTGHGVSGAFMTMIGNNMLNHIIHDLEITQPNEILNLMTPLLEKTLLHSEGKVKDGMDISIISIHPKGFQNPSGVTIEYSGAMNPLYYVENQEFNEIKADKVPIGGKAKEGFSYQLFQLSVNSNQLLDDKKLITDYYTLYLCTDGFQDQFGGTENRKFMVSKFKKLLLEISEKPMAAQKQILETTISNWILAGNETQTDDICVLGVRL
jgi:serine phosphatase RsbU (regulator of sigma subunit)